jgi:hypothetical protein
MGIGSHMAVLYLHVRHPDFYQACEEEITRLKAELDRLSPAKRAI